MGELDDARYVERQYRDSSNFDARVRIYELYAQNPVGWMPFLFNMLRLEPREQVLEVGAGTGNLWRDVAEHLPEGLELTLTDNSPGMLETARERLVKRGVEARFEHADVQELPYRDESFDVVISNHMLYHVPDRARALSELRRVLRPGGRAVIGTNDWPHLIELREIAFRFGVDTAMRGVGREEGFFDAEQAGRELSQVFSKQWAHRYHDSLDVTDARVLTAYVRSTLREAAAEEPVQRLEAHVAEQIRLLGAFHITTSAVVFVARREPEA